MADSMSNTEGKCVNCGIITEDSVLCEVPCTAKSRIWCCGKCIPEVSIQLAEANVKRKELFESEKSKLGKKKK